MSAGASQCVEGAQRDDTVFRAASGDCGLPSSLLWGAVAAVGTLGAVQWFILARLLRGSWLAPSGQVKPNVALLLILGLFQLSILALALGVFLQDGLFEVGLVAAPFMFFFIILLIRALIRFALKPFVTTSPDLGR